MYRVRTAFTGAPGAPWLSTFYFSESGGTAQQAATAAGTFWSAVDANMNNSVIWTTEADVATVNEVTGQVTSATATTPVVGAGGSAVVMLPPAAQGLVRWFTGVFVGGRQIRGRTFIPGLIKDANITDGQVSPATVSSINTAATNLVGDANSVLVVWSPTEGLTSGVIGGSTWSQFAILRSRRD